MGKNILDKLFRDPTIVQKAIPEKASTYSLKNLKDNIEEDSIDSPFPVIYIKKTLTGKIKCYILRKLGMENYRYMFVGLDPLDTALPDHWLKFDDVLEWCKLEEKKLEVYVVYGDQSYTKTKREDDINTPLVKFLEEVITSIKYLDGDYGYSFLGGR